jgi:hypothetical protein
MGDNRPAVYWEQVPESRGGVSRVLVIRASAVGTSCLWELVAAGQGVPPAPIPANLQRAFDEGNKLEPVVIKMLEDDYRVTFLSHQEEGELWLSDDVMVRYHPDGIANLGYDFYSKTRPRFPREVVAELPPRTCVVEVKALSNDLWQQAKRNGVQSVIKEYEWQLSVMMHDAGLPGLWVCYNKGLPPDELGNREPCEDQGKLYFQYEPTPRISIEEIQLKASLIKVGVDGEDITTSDRPCGDPSHYPCRYLHIRPEPEPNGADSETFLVPDDRRPDVDRLIRDYVYHKGQADEAVARRDEAKEQILQLEGLEEDHKRILTDKWRAPVVRGTTSYLAKDEMSEQDRRAYEAIVAKYTRKKSKAPFLTKITRIGE